jgi:butyrate kinase
MTTFISEETMYDLHRCLDVQLRSISKPRPTLIMPEADDPRTIEAAERLTKFSDVVLLTTEEHLVDLLTASGLEGRIRGTVGRLLRKVKCVDIEAEAELREEFAHAYVQLGRGKKWETGLDEARRLVREPVYFSVLATRLGYADMIVGGLTHASRDFFHPCLRLLERQEIVYEMGLFALPDSHREGIFEQNLVMFADVALNPIPTPQGLARIAVGACKTMRDTIPVEDLPYVNGALLSYSTRGSGEGPSVERVREAAKLIPGMLADLQRADPLYETIRITPELQISVAVSPTAARTKLGSALDSLPGAGHANVLIAPDLDVGNLLYHIYHTRYPDSHQLLVIGGIHNRALDFSRSSSADELVLGAKGLILRFMKSRNYRQTPRDHFFPRHRILAVNPGSTSTKVGLFEGTIRVFEVTERHSVDILAASKTLADQLPMRLAVVRRVLRESGVEPSTLHAVVGRGGLVRALVSGTYSVGDEMLSDLAAGKYGEHPANLGAPIARAIADEYGVAAFVVDPPVVDELDEVSLITGLPGITRRAAWHALNQKAVAKRFADERGFEYEQLNLIVAHLGGGISIGAHRRGRCVFVRDALYDGPMTPNRAGTLPGRGLIDLCFSGLTKEEITSMLLTQSGLAAHAGTTDLVELLGQVDLGNESARLVLEAMTQQIAMEIASLIPKFLGEQVDRIIITGGMAQSEKLTSRLRAILAQIPIQVSVMAGEDELEALRDGARRVLSGQERALQYHREG